VSAPRLLPLLFGLGLALAGCGSDNGSGGDTTPAATTTASTTEAAGPTLKIGLVTDIGGLDDRSFNFLANKGLKQAESELGVEGRVVVSRSNSDYVPNLSSLASKKYDLVVAVGVPGAVAVSAPGSEPPPQPVRASTRPSSGTRRRALTPEVIPEGAGSKPAPSGEGLR
jgi:basic membrane lipoprotein Med (substrate-binding protein (PBP1-ABC) superfamily)